MNYRKKNNQSRKHQRIHPSHTKLYMALLKHHNTLKRYLSRNKMTSKTQTKNYLQILMMNQYPLRHKSNLLKLWMQVIQHPAMRVIAPWMTKMTPANNTGVKNDAGGTTTNGKRRTPINQIRIALTTPTKAPKLEVEEVEVEDLEIKVDLKVDREVQYE